MTLNDRYQVAVNLLHLLIYEKKHSELLYAYSSPNLQLTSYLTNSVLQALSIYAGMTVEFQEVYLRDDIFLTLTDGSITRTAVLSKTQPSIEMQLRVVRFIDLFEETFKNKIPDALKADDPRKISRIIDYTFADQLIERCFEKSLTFPHIAHRPDENQPLSSKENQFHKLAYNLNEKSGPFLLGRLFSKARMETRITEPSELLEIIFNLREKGALKPIPPAQAIKLREEMLREKLIQYKKGDRQKGDRPDKPN
ncbi:MAG: hypothetical protein ACTSRS_10350 [Candidatus Helarchaeota archaeon]